MNVASLELSKELHELSGWSDTPLLYCAMWDEGFSWEFGVYQRRGIADMWMVANEPHHPAYDLGYLLRKLQDDNLTVVLRWNRDMGGRIAMKEWDNKYCIGTFDMPQGEYPIADTPEDAAAMLAIQLFKQGILIREATT